MQGQLAGNAVPEFAPPGRSSFQIDRAKTTTTAAAGAASELGLETRQRSASVAEPPRRAHSSRNGHGGGFSDAISRAASILAPSRKRSTGPLPYGAAIESSSLAGGPYGAKGPVLGRTSTFRLRPPNISSAAGSSSSTPSAAGTPQLRALESYNARNVAAALDPNLQSRQTDDVWQQVCIRVLPLFNGEGIRGFIEELNELVLTHVQRTFLRCQSSRPALAPVNPSLNMSSLVAGLITADLTDLIRIGLITLANKLSPAMASSSTSTGNPLSDEKLLARLNEIWLFFFTGVLPHLEGVFWVLRSDDRLRAAVGESEAGRTTGSSSRPTQDGFADSRIDVRRIALIEFRDCIVHPELDRLVDIFASYSPIDAPLHASAQSLPRRTTGGGGGGAGGGYDSQPSTRPPSVSHPYSEASPSSARPAQYGRSRSSPAPSASVPPPSGGGGPDRPYPNERHVTSPAGFGSNIGTPELDPRSPAFRSVSGGSQFRRPHRSASYSSSVAPARPFAAARSETGGPDELLGRSPAEAQALARRRQMIAILASLLTEDDRQAEMDELVRLLRPVYNPRYRQQPAPRDDGDDDDDDGDEAGGYRHRRHGQSGYMTPPPEASQSEAPAPLTASPIKLGSDSQGRPLPEGNDLPPPIAQEASVVRDPYPAATDGVTRQISARQRSRTMNSLDEEVIGDHTALSAPGAQDKTLFRRSVDIAPPARTGSASSGPSTASKKTRRLSFRPWLGRSNSAASSSATSNDGAAGSSTVTNEDVAGTAGGDALTPGTVEGDRLRRELLRRNSSRRTSDMSVAIPQLGVGYGQLAGESAVEQAEPTWTR